MFTVPDQRTDYIARLIAEEVYRSMFWCPECLLSDRGTNLVSKLLMDLCKMLEITKLSTTAYHPQCDGAVKRFNRILKGTLRKHPATFGYQWDHFLPKVLWHTETPLIHQLARNLSFCSMGLIADRRLRQYICLQKMSTTLTLRTIKKR